MMTIGIPDSRITVDEAMARLRRVCAGDGAPPPPYHPGVNPIGRPDNDTGRGLGTVAVDAVPPRPRPLVEYEGGEGLSVEPYVIGLVMVIGIFAAVAGFWAGLTWGCP